MRVVIEGFIYQVQAKGGISRIYNETLPRMCAMDKQLRATIVTDGTSMQPLPVHPSISYQHGDCDPLFRESRSAIWHSTYFTPPEQWEGVQLTTVYDMIPERFNNFFSAHWDDALRERRKDAILKADTIIAISENTKSDLIEIQGVAPQKIRVVHLSHSPVFQRLAPEQLPKETGAPFFLYVGDRNHYKNFDGLLKGFAAWKACSEATISVVGGAFSDKERNLIDSLGIKDRVKLQGVVSDEELRGLYNRAAAFIYPSYGEGFGIPLLEAMACGCPVIASDIPSSREVAGDCPLYFIPSEPESLPDLFSTVLNETRDSKRVHDGILLAGNYSWDKTAAQTLEVYRQAIADKGRYDCCAFPSGHFYSPLPDLEQVASKDEVLFATPETLEDINLNTSAQLALWNEMKELKDTFPFGDHPGDLRYGLSNGYFGHGDAWTLYGMLRTCKPNHLVEIGSGHSSAAILDINDLFLDSALCATFIDPFPERLVSLIREDDKKQSTIIMSPVQEVDVAVFEQLDAGDILFVDSSHVCKVGSDLNYLLFEILPRLHSGVIIHFHDVFYPFEYPRNWVMEGRFWNECYLLRAFLQNNSKYSILLFNNYLAKIHASKVARDVPLFMRRDPENKWVEGCSSLWLRKE